MKGLSVLARAFINGHQGGFPIAESRPFAVIADSLGVHEGVVLDLVRMLVDDGYLSRFGPIYDASRLGGGQTLAAMQVPEQRFATVADQVNALPAVAHNYRREHPLNMWFVVAAPSHNAVDDALVEIGRVTGLPVYNFPKLREFYLGLWLQLDDAGVVRTVPVPEVQRGEAHGFDDVDFRLIALTQAGIPLVEEPLVALAETLCVEPQAVADRFQRMLDSAAIRRIGAIPNHYKLGLRGNGMTVWDVPDELAVAVGERVGAMDFVSHSYLRPRYAGVWPYNLFAMVHGRDREEVTAKSELVAAEIGDAARSHDVLFSSAVLKKTGLRVAA